MPVYSFINLDTQEEWESLMSSSDMEKYLSENPKVNRTFRINIGDPVRLGKTKTDEGFKDVLRNIQQKHPLGKVI